MRKISLALFVLFLFISSSVKAQQDPMYTMYMFNSLAYNPAFAGTPGHMSVRALYRNQWWGIEGGPTTQTFSIHTPVNERVGVGLNLINDQIGATGSTVASLSYAYRIPFGKGTVSIGLQASAMNWRADWSVLKFKDPRLTDVAFEDLEPNHWMPNFGAGVFYYAPNYYFGLSVPHLMNADLRKDKVNDDNRWAQIYRHFFLAGGATFPVSGDAIIFKPSFLLKSVGFLGDFTTESNQLNRIGAPTEFDIDVAFLFYETLWVGTSFRSAIEAKQFGGNSSFDSVDFWATYKMDNGLRIGAAYDYTITKLQNYVDGSFEVVIGYDFNYERDNVVTPRYF